MDIGDRVYISHNYIDRNDLRTAYGAQRVVGMDARQVELEAWFNDDLWQTRLMLADGRWSPVYDMRPGKFVVPHSAVFPARTAILC